jgi:DNA helicase-2/ATP-dependent DNA helicase PcrA
VREGDPSSFEEERRLLFVGITRAMQNLTLTQTSERVFRGMRRTTISSPFLPEIASSVQRQSNSETARPVMAAMQDQRLEQARKRFEASQQNRDRPLLMTGAQLESRRAISEEDATDDDQGPLPFQPGMNVRHPRYGRGVVLEMSGGSHRATVTVRFENSGETQTFVASRCPLQPIGG